MTDETEKKYRLLQHRVPSEDDMTTVSHILRGRLRISQRLCRRLKREHGILLNGIPVYVNTVVRTGDIIELEVSEEAESDTIPQEMPLDIIYEDTDVLLLNKPAGICVHPTHGHWTGTLANGVAFYMQKTGSGMRVRPVHRLDMDTSGLVLFAKSQLAHQRLAVQLEGHILNRMYLALAFGHLSAAEGSVDGNITRNPDNLKERIVHEDGREAVTHYRLVKQYRTACLVELSLETGRTHQIRVHMAHLGHPLVGDPMYLEFDELERLYGTHIPGYLTGFTRQALHAYRLSFIHPSTHEVMDYTVSLPDDMKEIISLLDKEDEQSV